MTRHEYRCKECNGLMQLMPYEGSCSDGDGMICNDCGRKIKVQHSYISVYAEEGAKITVGL